MEKLVGSLFSCRSIVKSAIVESGVKPPHSKARVARETAAAVRPVLSRSDGFLAVEGIRQLETCPAPLNANTGRDGTLCRPDIAARCPHLSSNPVGEIISLD